MTKDVLLSMTPASLVEAVDAHNSCARCNTCARCTDCTRCTDCYGCYGCNDCNACTRCTDCYGCNGLRSKRHCFLDVQLTPDEYQAILAKLKDARGTP